MKVNFGLSEKYSDIMNFKFDYRFFKYFNHQEWVQIEILMGTENMKRKFRTI